MVVVVVAAAVAAAAAVVVAAAVTSFASSGDAVAAASFFGAFAYPFSAVGSSSSYCVELLGSSFEVSSWVASSVGCSHPFELDADDTHPS